MFGKPSNEREVLPLQLGHKRDDLRVLRASTDAPRKYGLSARLYGHKTSSAPRYAESGA